MLRSMIQVFVKDSKATLELYKKAFNAEVLCAYENGNGGYAHSELNIEGQVLAVSECYEEVKIGNTMQFCFHFGEGNEEKVRAAYEVLKDGATILAPIGVCMFSPLMFGLIDKFGVNWCIFV